MSSFTLLMEKASFDRCLFPFEHDGRGYFETKTPFDSFDYLLSQSFFNDDEPVSFIDQRRQQYLFALFTPQTCLLNQKHLYSDLLSWK